MSSSETGIGKGVEDRIASQKLQRYTRRFGLTGTMFMYHNVM
jgi:hypothetical protein